MKVVHGVIAKFINELVFGKLRFDSSALKARIAAINPPTIMAKNWIQKAINPANKGKLREALHAKAGEPIPAKKLDAAAKKSGAVGKEARLAKTLRGLRK